MDNEHHQPGAAALVQKHQDLSTIRVARRENPKTDVCYTPAPHDAGKLGPGIRGMLDSGGTIETRSPSIRLEDRKGGGGHVDFVAGCEVQGASR